MVIWWQIDTWMRSYSNLCCRTFNKVIQELCLCMIGLLAHRANLSWKVLVNANVDVMTLWPAILPDFHQIEHLWDVNDRRIRTLPRQLQILDELEQELIRVWNSTPQAYIRVRIRSMRRWCNAVIADGGGHTRYWGCYFHVGSPCEDIPHNAAFCD